MKKYMVALLVASAMVPIGSSIQANNTVSVAEAAKTGSVATEVFGRKWNLNSPRLSPDGTKMVYQLAQRGENYIAWVDLTKPNSQPILIAQSGYVKERGDRQIVSWRFVGNDTVVVSLFGRENFFGSLGDLSRLVAYDINKKSPSPRPLAWDGAAGNGGTIMHIDHKNKTLLVERSAIDDQGRPEVIKVDVDSGKFSMVQRTNPVVDGWFADANGVVRGGFSSSRGGTQKMLYRSDDSGPIKTISKVKDEDWTGGALTPSAFLNEPDMAYAISNKSGFAKAYKVNLATQEFVEMVKETEGYDVEGVITSPHTGEVMGFALFNGRSYVEYTDPVAKEVQSFLDDEFGKHNASIVSSSADFDKLIIEVAKVNQLATYFYYVLSTGEFRPLGYQSNTLKNAEINPMEAVDYQASDGMKIQAIVTYPRHRAHRKNLPVIVMPHGGPFGVKNEVEFGFFPWAQAMAEQGYVVIEPNYRGSGGYGTEFVKEGRKPNGYGVRMQDDLNDAVTWFSKTGLIDAERACIMGWSYGGYAAARGAQRDPNVWKCAMAGAGVYDIPLMNDYDLRVFGTFGASYQATSDDPVGTSPARFTDDTWAPIMILAAARDTRIPLEQGRTLASRLKGSGKVEGQDFKYIEQKTGTHNLPYEDVHIEWLEESAAWAQRFNPAYIASDPDKAMPIKIRSGS